MLSTLSSSIAICVHDEFDAFKAEHIESTYSYLQVNELLTFYVEHRCSQLRKHIVSRYGHKYIKFNGVQVDELCRWIYMIGRAFNMTSVYY